VNADPLDADARSLFAQHAAGARFEAAPPAAATTLPLAYDVQRRYVALLQAQNGAVVGHKIGLTSPRMQTMCGIAEPISGCVLARRVHDSGATVRRADCVRLGLEYEIAMRIGRAADGPQPYSAHSIRAHVDGVCAAIELVDDRHADYARLDVRGLVADNSWNAGIVLSRFVGDWPDLRAVEGVVRVDGHEVDRGWGRDVLGDPFEATAWLANQQLARGEPLRAGHVVMTGSLVPTRFPQADGVHDFELAGIGSVRVRVGA
jgi:2-keto-4-pentenoate hydratase